MDGNYKIAVIGSNSFSGSRFADFLLEQGNEIVGISRSAEPDSVFFPVRKKNISRYHFHQFDINHDLDQIMEAINDFRPDYVVNFAAQAMVAESWLHPEHWFQTNVVATVAFHDRLRRCSFLRKYVHISTPEVYGSCSGLVTENTLYNPSTPYAVSRAAADMSLMTFFKAYSFPVVFTRSANVYGAGQPLYRIIPKTIISFLTGKKLQLHGGGTSIRSFIHISDVADGTLKAAVSGQPGEIFHFATDSAISIFDLVKKIAGMLSVKWEDYVEIAGERTGKDQAYLLDTAKARTVLGWKASIDLEHGIEETIVWIKKNLERLKQQPAEYIHRP